MKVFVTGIAGFIGSHVADLLLDLGGFEVAGVDNFETGQPGNVPDGANVVSADFGSAEAIHFIHGFHPDVIVHTAASYKNPRAWGKHCTTNTFGTALMVELAQRFKARLIYFQTSLCYGPVKEQPIKVTQPINPQNSYAISKTAGEQYIINGDVDYVSFRLANVYGPRNLSGPIPTFFRNISEGKRSIIKDTRRDFVYIDDLLQCVIDAIDGKGMGVFHVSTGFSHAIRGLYNAISMNVGKVGVMEEQKAGPDDVLDLVLEPNQLYPKPATPLELGIKKTVSWYKENPVKETYTHLQKVNDNDHIA